MSQFRLIKEIKVAIMRTFKDLQVEGQPYSLLKGAQDNPDKFYTGLLPRILPKPMQLHGNVGMTFEIVYHIDGQEVRLPQDPKALTSPDAQVVDAEAELCWRCLIGTVIRPRKSSCIRSRSSDSVTNRYPWG